MPTRGWYWTQDRQTLWLTQVGPGDTIGGIEWSSSVDPLNSPIYVSINNSSNQNHTLAPDFQKSWKGGMWSALDATTGRILCQVPATGTNPVTSK
ncbi:polyvinyl alcohol dehydrogenase (cytochrome) [Pseudomonas luteola]|nr:polyvinyl alcohol dehydrogenase (cytochrome) [Pseudomonas zeshuii]